MDVSGLISNTGENHQQLFSKNKWPTRVWSPRTPRKSFIPKRLHRHECRCRQVQWHVRHSCELLVRRSLCGCKDARNQLHANIHTTQMHVRAVWCDGCKTELSRRHFGDWAGMVHDVNVANEEKKSGSMSTTASIRPAEVNGGQNHGT